MQKITEHILLFSAAAVLTAVCGCRTAPPVSSRVRYQTLQMLTTAGKIHPENPPVPSFEPKGPVRDEQSFGDYTVRIYRKGEASFEILRGGVRVYADRGYYFRFGSFNEEFKTDSLISIGSDITGDGIPNLVIGEWTGGNHCDFLFQLFEIGDRFRYIQTINLRHSELADFRDVDGDDALELPMNDWIFAYWRTSFIASPAPRIILKYTGKKYEMAPDLMRKPGFAHDELVTMAIDLQANSSWEGGHPPVDLWAEMLKLIYTGNMNQAWELAEMAWPPRIAGEEQFLQDFRSRLAESPFWNEIRKMNQESAVDRL